MPLEYPQPIAAPYGPFADIPDVRRPMPPPPQREGALHLGSSRGSLNAVNLRPPPPRDVAVLALHVSVGGDHATSFHNGMNTVKATAVDACVFCPGDDDAVVSWTVRNAPFVQSAILTVRAARIDGVISRKDVTAALTNGRGTAPGSSGGLPVSEALAFVMEHRPTFGDGVLTVEHSPYRFELALEVQPDANRPCYPSVAWSFAQVLAHSIELAWGQEQYVPTVAQPKVVDPLGDGRFKNAERALVLDLVRNGDLQAATIDVTLDTNMFAALKIDADGAIPVPAQDNSDALAMIWGDGPRIPIEAVVHARKHDGSRASTGASRRAVGRVHLLWDWADDSDKLTDWLAHARPGYPYISKKALQKTLASEQMASPYGSTNCPYDQGGKRGSTATPVFMVQDDVRAWGNTVELAGGARPWCCVTRTGNGLRGSKSMVMFQPAPVSGDRYRVAVYLTHAPFNPRVDDVPDMNVADRAPIEAPDAPTIPARRLYDRVAQTDADTRIPHARSGRFEVKRRAKVRVIEWPAGASAAAVASVKNYYRDLLGLVLDVATVTLPATTLKNAFDAWFETNAANSNLVDAWAFDPAAVPGAVAIQARTFAEFQQRVQDHFRFGKLYEATLAPGLRLGECRDQTKKIYVWGVTAAVGETPGTAIFGSSDRAQDIAAVDVGGPARWRRLCFASLVRRQAQDNGVPARRLEIDFTAGGQTTHCAVSWSALRLGTRALSRTEKQAMQTALANLVTALGAGPYDVDLTATIRGRVGDRDAQRWITVVREAIDEVVSANYAMVESYSRRQTYFRTNWLSKTEPLSTHLYAEAVRKAVKTMLIPMADHLRIHDARDFEGLVYTCYAPASNIGNFGVGANNTGGRMGVGYVTEFPTNGFAQQLMMSLTDVLGHEFGHAFWRGHALTASFGFAPFDGQTGHTLHDTCLMNYDLDTHSQNFCAHCVLSLRGWKRVGNPLTREESAAELEAEILAEGDSRAKAWKQLRRARFDTLRMTSQGPDREALEAARTNSERAWKGPPQDRTAAENAAREGREAADRLDATLTSARQWVTDAETSANDNFDDAPGIALLRALIRAKIVVGDYSDAWRLWQRLQGITTLTPDLCDAVSAADHILPGIVQTAEVVHGDATRTVAVPQYINLPSQAKYVGGTVDHVDRLGRRIKIRLTTTGPVKEFQWALLRHRDDGLLPSETVVAPPFKGADPDHTGAVWQKVGRIGQDGVTRIDNTHVTFEFELPDRPGRYKVAVSGAGRCVLSPAIEARAVMFVMSSVVDNATGLATPDLALTGTLNGAYQSTGVEYVHIGRETFPWPGGVYADDLDGNTKAGPFAQAAHDLRTAAARAPFAPGLATYAEHEPYLVQLIFVEKLARWAGRKRLTLAVDTTDAAPTVTVPVVGKANIRAQLWQGVPSDANPDATGPAPEYQGRNTPKTWLIQATFTRNPGGAVPVSTAALTAVASDLVGFPNRLDRIEADLSTLAVNHEIKGTLTIDIVGAAFVAGVDASNFGPARGMSILVADYPAAAQQSAGAHEIAHMLGAVANDGEHRYFYDIGSGPHCHAGIARYTGNDMGSNYYPDEIANATCVMYHRVRPANPLLVFCDDCKKQLKQTTWRRFT